MKKMFVVLSFVFAFSIMPLKSVEPLLELKPLPNAEQFSSLEDNDIWFFDQVMNYYQASLVYYAQIKTLEEIPSTNPLVPTLDDLESQELKVLKRFFSNADKLKQQLLTMENSEETKKVIDLKTRLKSLEKELITLKDSNFYSSLAAEKTEFYKARYEDLLVKFDQLEINIDSNSAIQNKAIVDNYKSLRNFDRSKYTVFSLSLGASQYYYNNDDSRYSIDPNISPVITLNFNPGRLFGMGRIVDFWASYDMLSCDVKREKNTIDNRTDRYSLGLCLDIPLEEILRINDFRADLKVGFGYFHTVTKADNINKESISAHGNVIKLELSVSNLNRLFPFSIYANFDFNKYNKDLIFLGTDNLNMGKPWVNSFGIGLRFPLWQSPSELQ